MTRAALLLALAACTGTKGTLDLQLATAPGSDLLSAIHRIRLTLTSPAAVFEATRTANGLDLSFEIDAVETNGVIYIEGFDESDAPIVGGQSPPFPLAGSDGTVVIYVAPPYSILRAPSDLLPARSRIGGTAVIYGAVLAGGLDEAGAPSASMAIYNIYDHTIGYGENMPVHRAGVTLAANDSAGVYVLGGTDEAAASTSTLHRFQTNIAPDGAYVDLGPHPGLESSGQRAVKIGSDAFLVTGAQPALLTASTITAITTLADVPAAAAPALTTDGSPLAAFVRDGTVGYYAADGAIGEVALPSVDAGRAITAGSERGTVIVVGGSTRDLHVVAFGSSSVTTHANALSVARRSPTIAATSRHILVAHGLDENGNVIATADILDATTLQLLDTQPLDPRTNAVALPMPNDQILITGGDYPGGVPDGLVELFTPPVPRDPARP